MEFVSAVARLAGYDEFMNNVNMAYVEELDSVLDAYSNHDAVKFLRKVRNKQNIGFDAITTIGVHSTIQDAKFCFLDGTSLSSADNRWEPGQDHEIEALFNDLYQKCDFHSFYVKNRPFYDKVLENAQVYQSGVDYDWLRSFYGKPLLGTRLIVSLQNVGYYGLTTKINGQAKDAVMVLSCNDIDCEGIPIFDNNAPLIIHESSHPICNPLIDEFFSQFNDNIDLATKLVADKLAEQNYSGAHTMLYETMVRAVCIQYAKSHANVESERIEADNWMKSEMGRGYIFMPEFIDAFQQNRDSIDCLMPIIINAVNNVDVSSRYSEIESNTPKIIGCSMAEGATNIAPSDSLEIKVRFDMPVLHSFGMMFYDDREDIMPQLSKCTDRIQWDESSRILTFKIVAKPNSEIGFIIPGRFFIGNTGYRGRGEAVVHFFTSE